MEEITMLVNSIDEYLQQRPKDERPKHCFHPSSLHKSARELYYHYLEGDNNQEFDPRILRIFDNGHDVHGRIQRYLKDIGLLKHIEVSVENTDYEIKGHADGILEIEGIEGVLEIKSMNSNQFYSCYDPKPEHLIQINVYMFCLGIPNGCLLYECKNNQELKEFYLKQDSAIIDPILAKIRYVQDCLKEGREPEVELN
jgi:hypothetical protein